MSRHRLNPSSPGIITSSTIRSKASPASKPPRLCGITRHRRHEPVPDQEFLQKTPDAFVVIHDQQMCADIRHHRAPSPPSW
jgi:hypothetical protein